MIQQFHRLLLLSIALFATTQLFAQSTSSEIGVWALTSNLKDTTLVDPDGDLSIKFDEDLGFGVSFNHYWNDFFSTEISAQKYGSDMRIGVEGLPGNFEAGSLDVTSLAAIAQLHFNRAGRVHPYLGAGIARLSGNFDAIDEAGADEDFDLDSEITWAASGGLQYSLTDRVALAAEVRYSPWSAKAKGDPDSDALDLDPLTYGAGVKFRF